MKASASACQPASSSDDGDRKRSQSPRAMLGGPHQRGPAGALDDGAAGGVGDGERPVARAGIDDDRVADDALHRGRRQRGKRMGQVLPRRRGWR